MPNQPPNVNCEHALPDKGGAASLDLRTTKCPLNFVKAKLALEKLSPGEVLEIWLLPESESALNIPQSLRQEGHLVLTDRIENAPPELSSSPTETLRCVRVQRKS